jgi:hypothetical protein
MAVPYQIQKIIYQIDGILHEFYTFREEKIGQAYVHF